MSIFTKLFKKDKKLTNQSINTNIDMSSVDIPNFDSYDLLNELQRIRNKNAKTSIEFSPLESELSQSLIEQNKINSQPVLHTYKKRTELTFHYNKRIKPSLVKGISNNAVVVRTKSGKQYTLGDLRKLEKEGKLSSNFYISDEVYEQGLHANDLNILPDDQVTNEKKYYASEAGFEHNLENGYGVAQEERNRKADEAGRMTNDLLTAGLAAPSVVAPAIATVGTFGVPVALATGAAAYGGNKIVDKIIQSWSGYDGEYGSNGYSGWADMVYDNLPESMKERMPVTAQMTAEMSNPGQLAGIAGGRMYVNGKAYAQNTAAMKYNETALPVRWNQSQNAQIIRPGETVKIVETYGPTNGKSYYGGGPSDKAGMVKAGKYNKRPDVGHGATTNGSRKHNQITTYTTSQAPMVEYNNPNPIVLIPNPRTQRYVVEPPVKAPPVTPPTLVELPQSIIEETWKGGNALHDWYAKQPSRDKPYKAYFPGGDGTPPREYTIWRTDSTPDIRVRRVGQVVGQNNNGNPYAYAVPDSTTYITAPYTGQQYPDREVKLIPRATPGNSDPNLVLVYDK